MAKIKKTKENKPASSEKKLSKTISYTSVVKLKNPKKRLKSVKDPLSSSSVKIQKLSNVDTAISLLGDLKKSKSKEKSKVNSGSLSPILDSAKDGLKSISKLKKKKSLKSKRKDFMNNNGITVKEDSDSTQGKFAELERKCNIKVLDIENAVTGVIKLASSNPHLQKQLFNEEELPLFLQINTFKIPKTKGSVKHIFRIQMKHSVFPSDSDICLIVPDVKGIPNKEHERHEEHYQNLLAFKKVDGIKKIMTFHEFRTEYQTFELKSRLVDLYDIFLVDGKISGKVVHKGGSIFYKKRKVPIPIKLQASKLKEHIGTALKKVNFDINLKGDSCLVQIGHSLMPKTELIENVYSVIEFLDQKFPGRLDNIRNLNIYSHRGSSIPIFISMKNPNDIEIPILKPPKPKAYKSYFGELTTQYNADVVVTPLGNVRVKRKKNKAFKSHKGGNDNTFADNDNISLSREVDRKEEENKKPQKRKAVKDTEETQNVKKKQKFNLKTKITKDVEETKQGVQEKMPKAKTDANNASKKSKNGKKIRKN